MWRIGTRVSLVTVAVLMIVLAGTGTWLAFRYVPHPSAATSPGVRGDDVSDTMHNVHLGAAYLLLVALLALMVFGVGLFVTRGRQGWAGLPVGSLLLGLGALFTGVFLPWDQIALRAVTVGNEHIRGFGAILHDRNVLFVLIGSDELSTPTVSRFFWMHTVVIPVLLIVSVVAITIGGRRRRPAETALPVEPLEELAHQ